MSVFRKWKAMSVLHEKTTSTRYVAMAFDDNVVSPLTTPGRQRLPPIATLFDAPAYEHRPSLVAPSHIRRSSWTAMRSGKERVHRVSCGWSVDGGTDPLARTRHARPRTERESPRVAWHAVLVPRTMAIRVRVDCEGEGQRRGRTRVRTAAGRTLPAPREQLTDGWFLRRLPPRLPAPPPMLAVLDAPADGHPPSLITPSHTRQSSWMAMPYGKECIHHVSGDWWYKSIGTYLERTGHARAQAERGSPPGGMARRARETDAATAAQDDGDRRGWSAKVGGEDEQGGMPQTAGRTLLSDGPRAVRSGWRRPPQRLHLLCSDPACSISSALSPDERLQAGRLTQRRRACVQAVQGQTPESSSEAKRTCPIRAVPLRRPLLPLTISTPRPMNYIPYLRIPIAYLKPF
ncbi:hypothetical protein BJ912DRAFT_1138366 [Pholiota molesta]|nr:hypothetical protein BJ912DRAFT_1138366 [Pholiota molesta]